MGSNSIYMGDDQRAKHPAVAVAFDALGALLSRESARDRDATIYARIVREFLAVLGAPAVESWKDTHYGGMQHSVKHPDSRIQKALQYLSEWQLRELGLLPESAPVEPPAVPS